MIRPRVIDVPNSYVYVLRYMLLIRPFFFISIGIYVIKEIYNDDNDDNDDNDNDDSDNDDSDSDDNDASDDDTDGITDDDDDDNTMMIVIVIMTTMI